MAQVPERGNGGFSLTRPQLAHALGMIAAALFTGLLTWLAWQGYRRPEFLLDLANAMTLC